MKSRISTPQTTNKLKLSGFLALLLAASVTLTACGGGGAVSGSGGAVNGDDAVSGGETPVPDGDDAVSGGETPVPDGDDAVSGGDAVNGDDAVSGGETPVPDGDDAVSGGDAVNGDDAVSGGEAPPGVKVIPAAAGVVGSVAAPALPSVEVISDVGGDRDKVNKEFLTASNVEDVREKVSMQIQGTTNNPLETGSVLQRSSTTNPPPFDGESETTQFRKADSDIFSHVGLEDEDNNGTSYVDYFTDYDFAADGDDSDYLVGGIALWVPKDSAITPWIGAAASGNDPFGSSNSMGIRAVLGSATYSGRARGIFTNKRDDVIQPNRAFKADVNLMANFGSVGMGGTISGTVSGFSFASVDSDEYLTSVGDNSVTLGAAPIGTTDSGFFTGNTSVIVDNNTFADTGKWGGQFYGNGDAQPGSVAGTFGASISDFSIGTDTVSILGVFGAYKSDETPVLGSGGGVASVNNEILTASATPAALTAMQTAANNNPLYGSVSQLSYGTRTFEVIPFIHEGELSYKTERKRINQDTGEVVDRTRYYDLLKFYPDYRGSDTVSTTRFAKDGAFRHVGLKFEYADARHNGEYSETAYIDVFTDYDLTEAGGDTDYLVGGIWLWAPGSEASRAGTWIGVSASGNDPFGNASGMGIAAVTGSAMYSGKAHGIASADNVGIENDDTIAITFDADVALTAEFGDDSTGGMISGTVSDFEFSNCEEDCGSGSGAIILKAAPIGDINSGFFTGSTDIVGSSVSSDGTTTTTEIDTIENVGKWGGQFYGNGEDQPGSVAGTFGATIDYSTPDSPDDPTLSFLGVFGAYKSSVNNELLTALATPGVQTNLQAAANNNPLYGSVSQLSYGTRTFEVIPFIHEGELSYKTERKRINHDTGAVFDHPRHYDSKFFKNRPDLGSDTFSTTRFAKDGAFRHVGLKYEYVDERHNGEYSQTAYIDVFTDYDLTEAGGDADYLVGGIWLWTPKLDGTEAWIGASASGNDPFGNASGMGIAAVTGSATYRGKAHGIVSVDNVGIENDDTIAITFDADVALTAEFGDDSTGGMISGTVSDFESSDAEFNFDGTDDTINLKPAPISGINSGFFTGSTDYVQVSVNEDGTTDIDPIENVGKWGGQFYGNGEDQPGSVAGTFGVTHGGSVPGDSTFSLLGIFGAFKDDE